LVINEIKVNEDAEVKGNYISDILKLSEPVKDDKEASYYPNETDSMKAISRNQVSFKKCINVLSKKTKRKIF